MKKGIGLAMVISLLRDVKFFNNYSLAKNDHEVLNFIHAAHNKSLNFLINFSRMLNENYSITCYFNVELNWINFEVKMLEKSKVYEYFGNIQSKNKQKTKPIMSKNVKDNLKLRKNEQLNDLIKRLVL